MPQLDQWGADYIQLGFRIHQHIDGYVDAYTGPPALRDAVLGTQPWPGAALVAEAERLANTLEETGYGVLRRTYLHKQVGAMLTTCRQLAGETFAYREEIRRCFDIDPQPIPEAEFEAAIEELQTLLPGNGPVRERMIAWRKQYEIAPATARGLLEMITDELRQRTGALYPLPPGEAVEFRLVSDQPWTGYNWYYGNYTSGVDLNTDLPIHAHTLTALVAHEAYPGHHTEHCLKEAGLFETAGWAEHSIFLISTPEAVIAEGIANTGRHVIFAPGELETWQAAHVYPAAGIEGDPQRERRIAAATSALVGVAGNAALLLHEAGRSPEDVLRYLMRYGLHSEQQAQHRLRFIESPLWRAYIFTYFYGERLMQTWIRQGNPAERFGTLLREQTYPSLIGRWIHDEQSTPGLP